MPAVFPPLCGASSEKCWLLRHWYYGHFLNRLIQFYSNNTTNLHHLTSHSTPCCPTKMEIVLWPYITVSSLQPMYSQEHATHYQKTTSSTPPSISQEVFQLRLNVPPLSTDLLSLHPPQGAPYNTIYESRGGLAGEAPCSGNQIWCIFSHSHSWCVLTVRNGWTGIVVV